MIDAEAQVQHGDNTSAKPWTPSGTAQHHQGLGSGRQRLGTPTAQLICVRCDHTPEFVLLSRDENRLIHAAFVSVTTSGSEVICGGHVVPVEAAWSASFAPGSIARCTLRAPSKVLHRVRLGRPVRLETGSWTGTPLCALKARGLWFPAHGSATHDAPACAACEQEFARVNTRHERASASRTLPRDASETI